MLSMNLDYLQGQVGALASAAGRCEALYESEPEAVHQERLERLKNIRDRFEGGGKKDGADARTKFKGMSRGVGVAKLW